MEQNLKFGLGLAWLAVLKMAEIKLQHAAFKGRFFYVFMGDLF